MPYTIRKVPKKPCYKVSKKPTNKTQKRVFSKCTSLQKAKKQVRLLNAIEHNPSFTPRNRTIRRK